METRRAYSTIFDKFLDEFSTRLVILRIGSDDRLHGCQLRTSHLLILVLGIVLVRILRRRWCSSTFYLALVILENESPDGERDLCSETLLSFFPQQIKEEDVEFLEFVFRGASKVDGECGESS